MIKRILSILILVLVEIHSLDNLKQASETYLQLKNQFGHWYNQDRNPAIDDYNGDRHRSMIELQKHLGQVNTCTEEIERLMGSPTETLDQPDAVLQREFQQLEPPFEFPRDAKIWIYEWRRNHDFVYFVLSKENLVIYSNWYHAFD